MSGARDRGSFCVRSAFIMGAEAVPVSVEVTIGGGLPNYTIIGMPDATVLEARHRVDKAIRACGFEGPHAHITVNLAPAELKKSGTGFDLPIAVAILVASGQIPTEGLKECLFVGELGLQGEVCEVRGSFAYAMLASREGLRLVCAPMSIPACLESCECSTLVALSRLRSGVGNLPGPVLQKDNEEPSGALSEDTLDFSQVCDQEVAKRALVVAAAGNHGIMMVGPPGAGKTMLARRLPTILPPLTESERVEALMIHSVAAQPTESIARGEPPFRAPHHSISRAGLVGGGKPVMPGEISLAHKGVLFLDELPEFANNVLQSLRQPMEDKRVTIVRADGSYIFPSDFMFVAAANPCPCGHLGDPGHACSCAPARVESYQARMGGPLVNRIDINIDVARPASRSVIEGDEGMSSAQMREMVLAARDFRAHRQQKGDDDRRPTTSFDPGALSAFETIANRLAMGGRSIARAARVARTIADIEGHQRVSKDDIIEACSYRGRSHG